MVHNLYVQVSAADWYVGGAVRKMEINQVKIGKEIFHENSLPRMSHQDDLTLVGTDCGLSLVDDGFSTKL